MRIVHNDKVCSSIGMCESLAPEFFEIGDDGALHVLNHEFDESQRDLIQQAVDACPTSALSIEE